MTDEELEIVAQKVARIISRSTLIPTRVQNWIRASLQEQWHYQINMVYLGGSHAIQEQWEIKPDGSFTVRYVDSNMAPFWIGEFRAPDPIKQVTAADLLR